MYAVRTQKSKKASFELAWMTFRILSNICWETLVLESENRLLKDCVCFFFLFYEAEIPSNRLQSLERWGKEKTFDNIDRTPIEIARVVTNKNELSDNKYRKLKYFAVLIRKYCLQTVKMKCTNLRSAKERLIHKYASVCLCYFVFLFLISKVMASERTSLF